MHIDISGHNMDVTPALRNFTQDKFIKLARYFDKITSMHIVFSIENINQIVEATVFVAKGKLHARAEAEDMYTAIDALVEKVKRQLIEHKEKIHHHRD